MDALFGSVSIRTESDPAGARPSFKISPTQQLMEQAQIRLIPKFQSLNPAPLSPAMWPSSLCAYLDSALPL
ncbi:hypothetical protein V6N11_025687 [Hibiscus sabdariffa]|uniref:Uncharacterized protein n=1 Tax=Hibiscus sabdariffa TaxID=183260 RepID=A0ABR2STE2_9ROSI